jgi:ornithine cyclodeaminase
MLMMDVVSVHKLLQEVGLDRFYHLLVERLRYDFSQWDSFQKSARLCRYFEDGAIELMPISNASYYSNKVVSTYPHNAKRQHFTVIGHALGCKYR